MDKELVYLALNKILDALESNSPSTAKMITENFIEEIKHGVYDKWRNLLGRARIQSRSGNYAKECYGSNWGRVKIPEENEHDLNFHIYNIW